MATRQAAKDPHVSSNLSTQPATSPSVPQTTLPLLPVFTDSETASAHHDPSPASRGILISLLQVVSVSILIVIGFVLLSIPLGFVCATIGAIITLAGNPVASAANPFAQTYNTGSAAAIGAVGGLILLPPIYGLCQLLNCIPNNDSQPEYKCSLSQIFSLARSSWPWVLFLLFLSPFIALIGNSIVFGNDNNWDAVGIGAFGGLVLALPAVLFSSCFHLFVLSIISPIWSAIMKGAQWVHVKLKEIWMNRNHSHSPLARDDPEINLEYQILPGRD